MTFTRCQNGGTYEKEKCINSSGAEFVAGYSLWDRELEADLEFYEPYGYYTCGVWDGNELYEGMKEWYD